MLRMLLFSVFKFGSTPRFILLSSCGSSLEFPSSTLIRGVCVLGLAPLSPDQTFQDLPTFVMYPLIASFLSLGIALFAKGIAALAQSLKQFPWMWNRLHILQSVGLRFSLSQNGTSPLNFTTKFFFQSSPSFILKASSWSVLTTLAALDSFLPPFLFLLFYLLLGSGFSAYKN